MTTEPERPSLTERSAAVPGLRVVIMGDSWISGLGVMSGQGFGELAAEALGAEQVLNLAGVSRTIADMVAEAETVRAFAPTLAIIGCGGTESLVHPGPVVKEAIERWGPRSWRGLTGLEPRPYYSSRSRQRLQQRIAVLVKTWFKRSVIALTGGRRRVSLSETRANIDVLIALLGELGVKMVFSSPGRIDERRFPGSGPANRDTEAELTDALAGRDDAVQVEVRDVLRCWDDYLKDNLHLNVEGHRRVAERVEAAAHGLLAGSLAQGRQLH